MVTPVHWQWSYMYHSFVPGHQYQTSWLCIKAWTKWLKNLQTTISNACWTYCFRLKIIFCFKFRRSLFLSKQIDNKSTLGEVMAWCHEGDKPLLQPMLPNFRDVTGITRPQWINICTFSTQAFYLFHTGSTWTKKLQSFGINRLIIGITCQ